MSAHGDDRRAACAVQYVEAPHAGGVELSVAALVRSPLVDDVHHVVVLGSAHELPPGDRELLLSRLAAAHVTVVAAGGPSRRDRRAVLDDVVRAVDGRPTLALVNHSFTLASVRLTAAIGRALDVPVRVVNVRMDHVALRPELGGRTALRVKQTLAYTSGFEVAGVSAKVLEPFGLLARRGRQISAPRLDAAAIDEVVSLPRPPHEGVTVMVVGRLDGIKNVSLALRVFARFLQREPAARLVVLGDGPLRADLEREAGDLGIADHVEFRGLVTDVLARLWQEADVLLHTAVSESYGLVATEAHVLGIPAVLSDGVPAEAADPDPRRAVRLPLDAPLEVWADALTAALGLRIDDPDWLARALAAHGDRDDLAREYRTLLARGAARLARPDLLAGPSAPEQ